jgi:hypothetical protein
MDKSPVQRRRQDAPVRARLCGGHGAKLNKLGCWISRAREGI